MAPRLSGVLRESSRTGCLLAFSRFFFFLRFFFEVRECAKWVSWGLMFFVKPLANGTEDGMFGHPTRDAIMVSPSCRFLNNHTYSCVVTRYGPLPQVLKKHGSSNGSRALQPKEY